MSNNQTSNADIVQRGWEAVAKGDWDNLVNDYIDDMTFIMPGQEDVLEGKNAFRQALDNLGAALPSGFDIESIRQIGGSSDEGGDVVSLISWKSDKVPQGSQVAVLFRFEGSLVAEERWFIDTEQWKAAF